MVRTWASRRQAAPAPHSMDVRAPLGKVEAAERGWIEELVEPGQRPAGESDWKRFHGLTTSGVHLLRAEADHSRALAQRALDEVGARRPAP